jgi:hypothetical protein
MCVRVVVDCRSEAICAMSIGEASHACNIDATELRANDHAGQSAVHQTCQENYPDMFRQRIPSQLLQVRNRTRITKLDHSQSSTTIAHYAKL